MDSPCVRECKLVGNACSGCGRTKQMIIDWSRYTEEQRKAIMKQLEEYDE
jgi:predicted Fe-S protein YdhL (DUF1289 family)